MDAWKVSAARSALALRARWSELGGVGTRAGAASGLGLVLGLGPVSAAGCGGDRSAATGDDGQGVLETSGAEDAGASSSEGGGRLDLEAPSLDLGAGHEGDGGSEGCGAENPEAELDFTYIWVSNSAQGSVSKLNTRTMIEEGRYWVREDRLGDPSRTSVNLNGDVAVANRGGGLTKVYARHDDCVEQNGESGLQTSTGRGDILPWGQEECVAWFSDLGYSVQRPVAWTAGEFDPQSCRYFGAKVWTAGNKGQQVWFSRVNGDDGTLDVEKPVPELAFYALGPYGGAADGAGNFWFTGILPDGPLSYNALVRVDAETTDYTIYPFPQDVSAYGITVDHNGRPWTAGSGVARFDPDTETFDVLSEHGGAGLMEDAEGLMWIANNRDPSLGSVIAFDVETMDFVKGIVATNDPAGGTPMFAGKGVSVDFDGYIWQISKTLSKSAHRFDPADGTWETYDGLTQPYTYSDMTGWGLKNALGPAPQG